MNANVSAGRSQQPEGSALNAQPLRLLIVDPAGLGTTHIVAELFAQAAVRYGQQPTSTGQHAKNGEQASGQARAERGRMRHLSAQLGPDADRHSSRPVYHRLAIPPYAISIAEVGGTCEDVAGIAVEAANADVVIISIDATSTVAPQTIADAYVSSLFGVRHIILAIAVASGDDFDQRDLDSVAGAFLASAGWFGHESVTSIPIAAPRSDIATGDERPLAWYRGPSLLSSLEALAQVPASAAGLQQRALRLPVREVRRQNGNSGFCGTIASGSVRVGDDVVSAVSGRQSRVASIATSGREVSSASAGDDVAIQLADPIDIARGDLIARVTERPEVSDQFAAHLLWLDDHLLAGRSYVLRIGERQVPATITTIKHRVDLASGQHLAARRLEANEIGLCNISTAAPVAFDIFTSNRDTGYFVLVDRLSNQTVAIGLIQFGLRRATNIHVEELFVDKEARASAKHQKPTVVWFTGLSGSGKSTLAKRFEKRLHDLGQHTYVLDGDNVRHGLNRDLGFTDTDRVENIRRIGEVAKLFADAGLIVLCSFISPFTAERRMVRELMGDDEFVEVFVDASIEECARRDPKGLYAKALAGNIKNFTGIDSPYEQPEKPDIHLRTENVDAEALVDRMMAFLREKGRI